MKFLAFFALYLFSIANVMADGKTHLMMVEQDGCYWCERWHEDIGDIYPKTNEGKIAPLKQIDINSKDLKDFDLNKGVNFTPTFILLRDNKEINRIEGYPGEDFFWGLLNQIISNSNLTTSDT